MSSDPLLTSGPFHIFRTLFTSIIAFLLLNPVIKANINTIEKPIVIIAKDDSESVKENINNKLQYLIENLDDFDENPENFLSFSNMEGLGLPPIEAAIAGNKVIGYTGEGGKDFFRKPIFEEIESGNIKHFCEEILNTVNNYPKNWAQKTRSQRKQLIQKYSIINEEKLIKKLINKVYSCY